MYANKTKAIPENDVDFGTNNFDSEELHYWRKHPNLHGWMEQLYYSKGGNEDSFNCTNLLLTMGDLNKLESAITPKTKAILIEQIKQSIKDIDINKSIKEFYDEIKKYKIEDIICIDETSVKSLQKRNHCYSEKGKRCVIKTQSQEVFKKYTGVFAISVGGVVNWDLYEKSGINTDRLIDFLEHNKEQYSKIFVLWGITSIYRWEMYSNTTNQLEPCILRSKRSKNKGLIEESEYYFKHFWNKENSLRDLGRQILLVDAYLTMHSIDHLFFNSFDPYTLDNLNITSITDSTFYKIKESHNDMLSLLCAKHDVTIGSSSVPWLNVLKKTPAEQFHNNTCLLYTSDAADE
mgnify:CR=1 FL=1